MSSAEDLRRKAEELKGLGEQVLQAQSEYEKAVKTLMAIFDQLPALVIFKDKENRIKRINQYGADLFGIPKTEIENQPLEKFTDDKKLLAKYARNDLDVMYKGEPKLNIIEPLITDSNRMFLTHKMPLIIDGEIQGVVGFSVEVTSLYPNEVKKENDREKHI